MSLLLVGWVGIKEEVDMFSEVDGWFEKPRSVGVIRLEVKLNEVGSFAMVCSSRLTLAGVSSASGSWFTTIWPNWLIVKFFPN
jgi:hypothetical protein